MLKVSRSLKENCARIYSAKETLEKEITRKDIPAEAKKRAQTLINSLDEEGNNVILLAKMKK